MKHLAPFTVWLGALLILSLHEPVLAQMKSDHELRGYKGAVSSVRTDVVEYSSESKTTRPKKRRTDLVERFDRAGNLLREISYRYDGGVLSDETNIYKSGRLVEMSRKHSPFTYVPDRVVYTYGPSGNIVEEKGYDLSGKLVSQHVYEYDGQNRKIQWTSRSFFEREDRRPHRWTYRYDDQNRLVEEKAFLDAGSGFVATDDLGGPHRKLTMYRDQTRSGLTLSFDSRGNLVASRLSGYDAKGNELEDIEFDASGSLKSKTRYEYVFDRLGNWIIQRTLEWDGRGSKGHYRLSETTFQAITYFR